MIALLTNDDGIDAKGFAALERTAAEIFDEVWVVAPTSEMSQIGHRVTTDAPISVEEAGRQRFRIGGTPADCTRVALANLMPQKPDWILSGINHGGNLGRHDFVISGTVAAVREGAFSGIPGIALSHFMRRGYPLDWERTSRWATGVVRELIAAELAPGEFWNVNMPHLEVEAGDPPVVRCEQERRPLPANFEETAEGLIYHGDYQARPRVSGSDVDVCFGGGIAVSLASI